MVSAHWTAAVMTPVMVGRYRGTVRKRGYAAADFYSAEPTNEALIPGKHMICLNNLFSLIELTKPDYRSSQFQGLTRIFGLQIMRPLVCDEARILS